MRDRFERQRVADVVAPGAARRLRNRDAEQPARRQLLDQRARKPAVLVDRRPRPAPAAPRAKAAMSRWNAACSSVRSRTFLIIEPFGARAVLWPYEQQTCSRGPRRRPARAGLGGLRAVRHRRGSKDFRPREVKSAVFTLASGQDSAGRGGRRRVRQQSRHVLVGHDHVERQERRAPRSLDGQRLDPRPQEPSRGLGAERRLHRARPPQHARVRRHVQLPAGTYEAFYSAFPNIYWSDDKGDTNTAQRFLNWLADEGFDEFRLTIRGGAQALDRRRGRARAPRVRERRLRQPPRRRRPEVSPDRLHPLAPDQRRHLRRRRSARGRRVRRRLDHQRRHPREDLEADLARLRARRRRREEPDGADHEDTAGRPLRRVLRDRRLARSERVELRAAARSAGAGACSSGCCRPRPATPRRSRPSPTSTSPPTRRSSR